MQTMTLLLCEGIGKAVPVLNQVPHHEQRYSVLN